MNWTIIYHYSCFHFLSNYISCAIVIASCSVDHQKFNHTLFPIPSSCIKNLFVLFRYYRQFFSFSYFLSHVTLTEKKKKKIVIISSDRGFVRARFLIAIFECRSEFRQKKIAADLFGSFHHQRSAQLKRTPIIAFSRFSFVSSHQTATQYLFCLWFLLGHRSSFMFSARGCILWQFFVYRTICNCQSFIHQRRMEAGRLVKNCIGITFFEPNLFRLRFVVFVSALLVSAL